MPYKIVKSGKKWKVVKGGKRGSRSGGKFKSGHTFGSHSSKAKAMRQLSAIKANEWIEKLERLTIFEDINITKYPVEAWIILKNGIEIEATIMSEGVLETSNDVLSDDIERVVIWY